MQRIPFIRIIICLVALAWPADAATKGGFPEFQPIGKQQARLSGQGTLKVAWIKVYDIGLYLADLSHRTSVLENVPKRLDVSYRAKASAEKLVRAGYDVLKKNWSAEELQAVKPRLKQIDSWYRDARPGDTSSLIYEPEVGTWLVQNGVRQGPVPGEDFARIYFSIWLGAKPARTTLRDQLLSLPDQ